MQAEIRTLTFCAASAPDTESIRAKIEMIAAVVTFFNFVSPSEC